MKRERKLYYVGVVAGVIAMMAVQMVSMTWGYAWYIYVVGAVACGVLYDIGYRVAVKIAGKE